jgi:hypothetical protein
MGDRSNVFFRSGRDGIGVYAHWSGESMADAAMRVVKSKAFNARLGDANYATRVGVQLVLETLGADSKSDTGFGLWTSSMGPDDNEYRWIVIDVDTGQLFVAKNWKKPTPSERVAKPTVAEIRRRMRGEPVVSSKKKKAPSRGSAKKAPRNSSRR